jgi:RNA polymerase sigma factor (sigma-70 family)
MMYAIIASLYNENSAIDNEALIQEDEYTTLTNELEKLLAAAQPRLVRLALAHGVAPDSVEDVVQETLVTAWQNLAHLRSSDRFEAWLNGICRNVSMRWTHAQGTVDRRQSPFSSLQPTEENDTEICALDIADPQALDLAEELNRQDLATLLDRAMEHLPAATRKALEMHYIAEMPQREVALQLGMTINALEVKLHRARRQLRQILHSELRVDIEAFGLTLDNDTVTQGWRETSIWCCICGRRRLQGIFEPQPAGDVGLRMRCPACSTTDNMDIISTGNMASFADMRSFRPAFKRVLQLVPSFYTQAFATGHQRCPHCSNIVPLGGIEPETLPAPFYRRLSIVLDCPTCGKITSSIFALCIAYPPAYQFIMQHERYIIEPEELIEYEGQAAILAHISDVLSSAQLSLILHRHTLQLLTSFQK